MLGKQLAWVGKEEEGEGERENEPWSVILDVVFLDLLDVVVCLRVIHAFDTADVSRRSSELEGCLLFPCKIS